MATKTLDERIADAQQRSVQLYLQRQEIEAQRQMVTQAATRCDQALIRLDGELAALTAIKAEVAGGE